ncbi:tyrosine-type recombinase/integrase [Sulfurovum sp. XTW-4]|uniref:Tyrosine-type recombinase/integrase n=1 Tax=Sulfurovum xiamenensis TaxID=3019066 RepID=A0ABT7QSC1_9BACT|nr:site-specific integrase [Sulfurovum xiamenensis]MDM5263983.1 tyrosine-type recombinase/integrase [Sulfurovum xiamenensis]
MLIDNETGFPDYWSTLFSITQHRSKGDAANTIEQVLRHLIILKLFLKNYKINGIDLENRIDQGKILHLHEIEYLCDLCKLYLEDIREEVKTENQKQSLTLKSLEAFRSKDSTNCFKTVGSDTVAQRIRQIRDFLVWIANVHMARLAESDPILNILRESQSQVKTTMTSRIPSSSSGSSSEAPMGLSDESTDVLLSIINRNSPDNPWKSEFTKVRNELIILWLYTFGLRKGELLSIKISDIDFRAETVQLVRRPDDPQDPRVTQPLVKTLGRKLAIPKKIISLTENYIIEHRKLLPKSKKHEYLFVADKSGSPLSLVAVNKLFNKIKQFSPEILKNLTPHILRHSWNDRFSAKMDEKNISEEKEKKIRSQLMGWSESSNSAATYTKRHTQTKANEVILEMGNEQLNRSYKDTGDKK